tara:strand:+ start:80 stop:562 length:483 start_codon:yes stop_codon:yes gene_type:complete
MMAVGKSTIGRLLSQKLAIPFEDLDDKIEKRESLSIKKLFDLKGESYFRKVEESECLKIINQNGKIIAFGGGTFMNQRIREEMKKSCFSIWLDLSPKKIFGRVTTNKERPLLINAKSINDVENIYLSRKKIYSLADYRLDCSSKNKEQIIKEIEKIYENI